VKNLLCQLSGTGKAHQLLRSIWVFWSRAEDPQCAGPLGWQPWRTPARCRGPSRSSRRWSL